MNIFKVLVRRNDSVEFTHLESETQPMKGYQAMLGG